MPKSIERRKLDLERRVEERRKDRNRNAERTLAAMLIDEETGQIAEKDDNWISLGYIGKRKRR
jgi:hypothetical protein